jgi:hypothetical protein
LDTGDGGLGKRLLAIVLFLVVTVFAILGWGSITSGPGYMQVRIFVAILAAITFYLLYSDDLKGIFNRLSSEKAEEKKQFAPHGHEPALPPAYSVPASSFVPHRVDTAEMVQPPSVTEPTTRLLEKEER